MADDRRRRLEWLRYRRAQATSELDDTLDQLQEQRLRLAEHRMHAALRRFLRDQRDERRR